MAPGSHGPRHAARILAPRRPCRRSSTSAASGVTSMASGLGFHGIALGPAVTQWRKCTLPIMTVVIAPTRARRPTLVYGEEVHFLHSEHPPTERRRRPRLRGRGPPPVRRGRMTAAALLAEAEANGVTFYLAEGALRYRGELPEPLFARLWAEREAVRKLLAERCRGRCCRCGAIRGAAGDRRLRSPPAGAAIAAWTRRACSSSPAHHSSTTSCWPTKPRCACGES